MNSLSAIARTPGIINTDRFTCGRESLMIGEASPPFLARSISETQMSSHDTQISSQDDVGSPATNGRPNQCSGINVDASRCARDQVTTTKQSQKNNPKANKTDAGVPRHVLLLMYYQALQSVGGGSKHADPTPKQNSIVKSNTISYLAMLCQCLFF